MLLDDWRSVVARISKTTGVRWPGRSDLSELQIDRYLTEAHRHHVMDEAQLNARVDVADWVKEAYAILRLMSRGMEHPEHHRALDHISAEFDKAAAAFGVLLAGETEDAETRLRDSSARAEAALGERDIARAMLVQRETQLSEATSSLQHAQQQIADNAARLDALDEELVATRVRINDAESVAAARQQEAEQLHRELEATRNLLRDNETETQRLSSDAAQAAEYLRAARAQIDTLTCELIVARGHAHEAETSATVRQQEVERLQHELEAARGLLRDSQTHAQRLGGDVAEAAERLRDAHARIDELTGERDTSRSELAIREAELGETRAALQNIAQTAAVTTAAFQAKEAELAAQAKESAMRAEASRNEAQHLYKEIQKLEQLHRDDESRVITITRENENALAAAYEDHERTRHELSVTQAALRDVRLQNESVGAALKQTQLSLQENERNRVCLAQELESANAAVAKAADEFQKLQATQDILRRAADEADQARNDIARLRDEAKQRQSQLQCDITARDMRMLELQRELDGLREQAQLMRSIQQADERQRLSQALVRARGWSWLQRWRQHPTARQRRDIEAIRSSGLFDALWYLKRYPDVAAVGQDPLLHYVLHGAAEGRDPHPLFDSKWYLEQYPDCCTSQLSPLGHYVLEGVAKGCDPNPLFDTDWYLQTYSSVMASGLNPLKHYWTVGGTREFNPCPMFDNSWYLNHYPDVAKANENALHHFLVFGIKEGRQPLPTEVTSPLDGPELRSASKFEEQGSAPEPQDSPSNSPNTQEADLLEYEKRGVFNKGWYGVQELSSADRYYSADFSDEMFAQAVSAFEKKSQEIGARFYGGVVPAIPPAIYDQLNIGQVIQAKIACAFPVTSAIRFKHTYSIVTSFYRHKDYFLECAKSVQRLLHSDFQQTGLRRVEWIVVNDDPSISEHELKTIIPEDLYPFCSFYSSVSNGKNGGIVKPLNIGISQAHNDWLLFLDCDDCIEEDAIQILEHYCRRFPQCRFISSAMIDIDERGTIIRRNMRFSNAAALFDRGMFAGHLKAIRKDLLQELGSFSESFPGCQDYDFALNTAVQEPILLIPEYLYRYRWHYKSQSVEQIIWQNDVAKAVRRSLALKVVGPVSSASQPNRKPATRGLCLVRTQGKRIELLLESINSIAVQSPLITPCVIVHAEQRTYDEIKLHLSAHTENSIVLHAPDVSLRRGYPLNIGINYAIRNEEFDFIGILDDDDIYYPFFAERMIHALNYSRADFVYAGTNKREPGGPLQPGVSPLPISLLVTGNFIPTNSFVVRTSFLRDTKLQFRDDLNYVEDWDFLLRLVLAGARSFCLFETLAEFRIIGDGNREVKSDPDDYFRCAKIALESSPSIAKKYGISWFYSDVLSFDFPQRGELTDSEITMFKDSERHYQEYGR
ncbi:MAG: glycosyltransferase [Bradyrhizobium sp.]|nr:glycosyltransferase [Bradyrhizobium sp.]